MHKHNTHGFYVFGYDESTECGGSGGMMTINGRFVDECMKSASKRARVFARQPNVFNEIIDSYERYVYTFLLTAVDHRVRCMWMCCIWAAWWLGGFIIFAIRTDNFGLALSSPFASPSACTVCAQVRLMSFTYFVCKRVNHNLNDDNNMYHSMAIY